MITLGAVGKGDMEKSTYDTNDDGAVDNSEKLEGSSKAQVQVHAPSAHKASHQDGGADEVAATGLVGRINYVLRGDVDGWDFQIGNFTTDGSAHELDLSGIVPAGAIAVNLRIYIIDETTGLFVRFIKNGVTYATNCLVAETKITGVSQDVFGFIGCDTDRKLSYTTSNTTITAINVYVLGWLI